jgi:hypothetical protein
MEEWRYSTSWRLVVSFPSCPIILRSEPLYSLYRRLGGSHSWPERCREWNPDVSLETRDLATILNELSLLRRYGQINKMRERMKRRKREK